MEGILEIVVGIWSCLSVLWIISFIPPLRTKTMISKGGARYESGKNIDIKRNYSGNYDAKVTPIYDYTESLYYIEYSKIGYVFKAIGTGGLTCAILYTLKDVLVEIACMCSLGLIDLRDEYLTIYCCVIVISLLRTVVWIFGHSVEGDIE